MVRRRGPRALGTVLVMLVGVLAAGCVDSDYRYVKNGADRTYFKVPAGWHLYGEEELLDEASNSLSEDQRRARLDQGWQVAFDASPRRSIRHVGNYAAHYPEGIAMVRSLTPEAADALSLGQLADVFGVQSVIEAGQGEMLDYEHVTRDGGFRGVHLVAQLQVGGKVALLDQTILVNQASTKVYALIVSCTAKCFDEHQDEIDEVVDSWTVKAD
jgi:hypothetical protein